MRALWPVSALLLSVAILMTGNGLQGVLLPVRAGLEDFSTFQTGLIASCYFAGFASGCIYGVKLISHVGHIRTFAAMTALASTTALAHALWVMPLSWWAFRFTTGFCFAVMYVVIESWLNERATSETRGTVLSAYMVINLTVLTLGQMMLPLYDPGDVMLFAIASILVSLAALPVALTGSIAPAPIRSAKPNIRHLFRISPAGVVGCAAVGLANSSFWALAPVFGQAKQFDETGIALFMSATVIGGAIGQWPIGYLSDKFDRRAIMLMSAALCIVSSAAMVLQPFDTPAALMVTGAFWGASALPLYSLSIAHTNDFAEPEEFVQVSSGLLLVYAGGAVAGPMLASAAIGLFGIEALYVYTAAVHFILIIFVGLRMRVRAPAPSENHVSFSEALVAAQTTSPVFDEETQAHLEEAHTEPESSQPPAQLPESLTKAD